MSGFSSAEKNALRERASGVPEALQNNMARFPGTDAPILLAGAEYCGIWLEHNQDNLFITDWYPEVAWQSQKIFIDKQRADGMLPAALRYVPKQVVCFAQLQTVYAFARCALETAKLCHRPEEDFAAIYRAGCRYDEFLQQHRNRSGSGLVEMYCTYDTGHDNSPRVRDGGIPNACPGRDAVNMPDLPCMPLLAADLSATRYGGLTALAELAEMFGDSHRAAIYTEQAAELKARMFELLYDPADEFFYDRAPQGLRRYRTEHITRLFLNGVLNQQEFDSVYDRYFAPGKEFFTAFPYPSLSPLDKAFCKNLPPNCWGSNTQMLTLLRALIWMPRYNRTGDLCKVLKRVLRAFCDFSNDFGQELDPFTGRKISGNGSYTPAMVLFYQACNMPGVLEE